MCESHHMMPMQCIFQQDNPSSFRPSRLSTASAGLLLVGALVLVVLLLLLLLLLLLEQQARLAGNMMESCLSKTLFMW